MTRQEVLMQNLIVGMENQKLTAAELASEYNLITDKIAMIRKHAGAARLQGLFDYTLVHIGDSTTRWQNRTVGGESEPVVIINKNGEAFDMSPDDQSDHEDDVLKDWVC